MWCRKCGIFGDPLRRKWWQKLIPNSRRFYCAGCGKIKVSIFAGLMNERRDMSATGPPSR